MNKYKNCGGGKKEYVYLATTNDKYELPLAVAESQYELAGMLGVTQGYIAHYLKRDRKITRSIGIYKVDITDV